MSAGARVVAVIGASASRHKYGNKAVRAYANRGYHVVPVNPREPAVEGWPAYRSILDFEGHIDLATFYVPPHVGERLVDDVARKGVREVWLNPGSESADLVRRARALGLQVVQACSIIGIDDSPSRY